MRRFLSIALGGLLLPILREAKYSEKNALGFLTTAGALGILFPPCLPLILYVFVANNSANANLTIKEMFLGGIGPGILLVILGRDPLTFYGDMLERGLIEWSGLQESIIRMAPLLLIAAATPAETTSLLSAEAYTSHVLASVLT